MTEERLKRINEIAKVIEKIEEGCKIEIRLNSVRTTDVFGVTIKSNGSAVISLSMFNLP